MSVLFCYTEVKLIHILISEIVDVFSANELVSLSINKSVASFSSAALVNKPSLWQLSD